MIKEYSFFDGGTIEFDDSKSVRELISFAFEVFGYYEPLGMEIVTIFQCHHSRTSTGWFTTDIDRSCFDEIENCNELCFAYHMPGVFYFAEGGWGHHMKELGNHPVISDPIDLNLRFEHFKNTVVINGNYHFSDIIQLLKKADYIPNNSKELIIHPIGASCDPYRISFTDKIMEVALTEFQSVLSKYTEQRIPKNEFAYHEVIEIR